MEPEAVACLLKVYVCEEIEMRKRDCIGIDWFKIKYTDYFDENDSN